MRILSVSCAALAALVSGCTTISTAASVTGTLVSTTASVASSAVSATAAVAGAATNAGASKAAEKVPLP